MIIGVPREIKNNEFRVGMVPAGVRQLARAGHTLLVEKHAGEGSGITDEEYIEAGAKIIPTAAEVYGAADMIVKVKEPLPVEYKLIKPFQIVFTYFHFASSQELTDGMLERRCISVAYETIETPDRKLPLLTPMSEVAGRMSIQEGAKYLEKPQKGRGILLSGVPGVAPAEVLVIGGGVVGANAARIAAGLGAMVTILDVNLDRLRYLADIMPANVTTVMSNEFNIRKRLRDADLVVGAVLVTGARAPQLITRDMLKDMKPGAVIVDVAIDQGGCVETARPTTHEDPVYIVDGVVHYCVANMPGAVGRTSTYALTNVTLPYAMKIAELGFPKFCMDDPALALGVNTVDGKITYRPVAEAFAKKGYTPIEKFY
ncbi:MAG: alanine dehydrogenase [Candidatus Sumerlaeaceae bacterium]|nr:alanine dehydrogenase [Candidatus Sumerlaeaceae bacterium]